MPPFFLLQIALLFFFLFWPQFPFYWSKSFNSYLPEDVQGKGSLSLSGNVTFFPTPKWKFSCVRWIWLALSSCHGDLIPFASVSTVYFMKSVLKLVPWYLTFYPFLGSSTIWYVGAFFLFFLLFLVDFSLHPLLFPLPSSRSYFYLVYFISLIIYFFFTTCRSFQV